MRVLYLVFHLLPAVLSLLLLAAHFLRAGFPMLVGFTIGCLALLLVRHPWAARALQILLALGAVEWLRTALALLQARQQMGLAWQRPMVILVGVAVFAAVAALLFQTARLRRYFGFAAQSPPCGNRAGIHGDPMDPSL